MCVVSRHRGRCKAFESYDTRILVCCEASWQPPVRRTPPSPSSSPGPRPFPSGSRGAPYPRTPPPEGPGQTVHLPGQPGSVRAAVGGGSDRRMGARQPDHIWPYGPATWPMWGRSDSPTYKARDGRYVMANIRNTLGLQCFTILFLGLHRKSLSWQAPLCRSRSMLPLPVENVHAVAGTLLAVSDASFPPW